TNFGPVASSAKEDIIDDPTRDFPTTGGAVSNAANVEVRPVTLPSNNISGNTIDTGLGGRTARSEDTEAQMDLSKELADLRKLNESPAKEGREQDRLAQERGYQQELAKKRAEEAKIKAVMSEERADNAVINGTLLANGKAYVLA